MFCFVFLIFCKKKLICSCFVFFQFFCFSIDFFIFSFSPFFDFRFFSCFFLVLFLLSFLFIFCFCKSSSHPGRSKVTRVTVGRDTNQIFRVCKNNLVPPKGRNIFMTQFIKKTIKTKPKSAWTCGKSTFKKNPVAALANGGMFWNESEPVALPVK